MKKSILLLFFINSINLVIAQESTWSLDKVHSKMTFTATHLSMSEIDGVFKDYSVTITSTNEDFSDAVFEATADLKTISTNNEMRDRHLQKEDMFNTEKFPTLTFKSTGIEKVGEKMFKLTGDLTIKGITKQIILDLKLLGTGQNRRSKKDMAGFKITGEINRTDFGVGNMPSLVVSEGIQLTVSGEFTKE